MGKHKLKSKSRKLWDPCRIGTVGELYVALDLIERGFEPYLPVPGRQAKYDMVAYNPENGIIYPVSVKTYAGTSKNFAGHDGDALRDGGIVAKVRYQLPRGALRRLSDEALHSSDNDPLPSPYIREISPSRADEVLEFIEGVEPGSVIPTQILLSCCPMPRASLYHVIDKLVQGKFIKKGRFGKWVVLPKPEPPPD